MTPGASVEPAQCPECGSRFAPEFVTVRYSLEHYRATGQAYRGYLCLNVWHAVHLTAHRQARINAACGLLPGEMALTLESLVERGEGSRRLLAEAHRMLARPFGMLTLWGGAGNGKTLTLMALVNAFRERGQLAIYVRLPDLLEYLRQGYEGERFEAQQRYRQIAEAYLLALDEVDKTRWTEWAREVVFTLMDDRYRLARERGPQQRHTLLALNQNPETLPAYLISRLRYDLHGPDGFRIVHNMDPDARESGL